MPRKGPLQRAYASLPVVIWATSLTVITVIGKLDQISDKRREQIIIAGFIASFLALWQIADAVFGMVNRLELEPRLPEVLVGPPNAMFLDAPGGYELNGLMWLGCIAPDPAVVTFRLRVPSVVELKWKQQSNIHVWQLVTDGQGNTIYELQDVDCVGMVPLGQFAMSSPQAPTGIQLGFEATGHLKANNRHVESKRIISAYLGDNTREHNLRQS